MLKNGLEIRRMFLLTMDQINKVLKDNNVKNKNTNKKDS